MSEVFADWRCPDRDNWLPMSCFEGLKFVLGLKCVLR